ncbi:MAG TPA: gluconate 2-dehydrogenase subunit 3 family protein, partial [Kiritimatiellia bacterium]|nr:gluconate 2-dehydrogenase subunit 3 family protein [Kiritimatiellia bacterium]
SRRSCLKVIAAAAGGAAAGVGGAVAVGRLGRAPEGPWRVLTPEEARLADAIAEQIIPADRDPGAREAGVVHYIDRQLDGPLARFAARFRTGLRLLQQTCQARHGRPFETLSWPEQTRLLEELECNKAPKDIWPDASARDFFNLCRDFTMQGFYGSPRHGGNRNYVSYKMMGLEYPRLIGQNR